MMRWLVILIVAVGLGAPVSPLMAADWTRAVKALAAEGQHPPRKQFAPRQRPGITSKQVAALVKRKHGSARILNISLIESKGPPVYKVKTLSAEGVVKFVYVDAIGGEVFD